MKCCVPGCKQRSKKGLSFHRFPLRDQNLSQSWIDQIYAYLEKHNCEREGFKQNKQSVLCSNHFLKSDYVTTVSSHILKASACPSVFSCDPNPLKKKLSKKLSSTTPVLRLRYILPKVDIDELEYTKNISYIQDSVLEEPVIKETRIEEPMIKKSTVEELMLKKTEFEEPMLQEVEALMLNEDTIEEPFIKNTQESFLEDLNKNVCTECSSLKDKIQKLEEKMAFMEKLLFKLKSCNESDICDNSSLHHEQLSQESSTPIRTIQNDHCYVSTLQSLRRKLDFSKAKAIRMTQRKRNTVKKLHRSTIKVSQLQNLLESMKEEKIARPELLNHLEQVFGEAPLHLYERKVTQSPTNRRTAGGQ
ncbi:PREDICTED: THAP domain-containing protein 1-like [Cyphomyrmex costatus]|uniref:THAP domain-containing protein 1-like n=1 Tax=Cyphomyrmex costatus TaxID=456900 RepID=UPI00085226CD|nr:PREDICTED: THAP domain-containing protein 1-like [Cyphomyrmex costatus]